MAISPVPSARACIHFDLSEYRNGFSVPTHAGGSTAKLLSICTTGGGQVAVTSRTVTCLGGKGCVEHPDKISANMLVSAPFESPSIDLFP